MPASIAAVSGSNAREEKVMPKLFWEKCLLGNVTPFVVGFPGLVALPGDIIWVEGWGWGKKNNLA